MAFEEELLSLQFRRLALLARLALERMLRLAPAKGAAAVAVAASPAVDAPAPTTTSSATATIARNAGTTLSSAAVQRAAEPRLATPSREQAPLRPIENAYRLAEGLMALVQRAIGLGASDVHLAEQELPRARVDGGYGA